MDILIEVLLEVYMELMFLMIPENKRRKKHYVMTVIIAIVFTFGIMALAFFGIYLVAECEKSIGFFPISIAVILSAIQIGVGIRLYNQRNKR